MLRPDIAAFHDPSTGSVQYVLSDPTTRRCAVIDPVLDYDEKSGSIATTHADQILAYVHDTGLEIQWILDTHPHADHLSAADYLKRKTGAQTGIGTRIVEVQKLWSGIYNTPDFPADGSQWDRLFDHGDTFEIGALPVRVMLSTGHTLASVTYVAGDVAFVHDTLFMPDSGTARTDFPGGNAEELWRSIADILALPPSTRLFTGHDYQPGGREAAWESTVQIQQQHNIHLRNYSSREAFIDFRRQRDATLPMPRLILHALQVNINGGRPPEPKQKGMRDLKMALGRFPK